MSSAKGKCSERCLHMCMSECAFQSCAWAFERAHDVTWMSKKIVIRECETQREGKKTQSEPREKRVYMMICGHVGIESCWSVQSFTVLLITLLILISLILTSKIFRDKSKKKRGRAQGFHTD